MQTGNTLWKDYFQCDMEAAVFHGIRFDIYKNQPKTLYCSLKESAKRFPEKAAIIDQEKRVYTYSRFLQMVDDFAYYLSAERNLKVGSRIGLLLYNDIEFCTAFFAINKLGCVTVPLPGKFKQQELLSLIDKAVPELLICHEHYASWFTDCPSLQNKIAVSRNSEYEYGFSHLLPSSCGRSETRIESDAPAILMYTSGTTSESKGVSIHNYSVMHSICSYQKTLNITDRDCTLLAVPIYHITGLVAILGLTIYCGGTVYLHRFFNSLETARTLHDEKITFFHASPTVFSMLLTEQASVPSIPDLRIMVCGSSNMAKEKILQLHKWMPQMQFRTVYGLTETTSPATIFPCDAAQSPYIGSSGIPIPGLYCKIVSDSDENQELTDGEVGEILLRGANLLSNYDHNTPIAYDRNGWFHTGDLGYLNKDGYLYISGRKKDMINRGGEKICCHDVENILYSLDQVEEAAIVGIPDSVYGETAAAAIVLHAGASLTLEEMQDKLKDKLARYKIPTHLLILEKLPITPNNKVDKKTIKKLFNNHGGTL